MSNFAERAREEIAAARPQKGGHHRAFCRGLLLMGRRCGGEEISTATEHALAAKLYASALRDLSGARALRDEQPTPRGRVLYTLRAPGDALRRLTEILWEEETGEEALPAFLAGAFLSCGSINEPAKGYHLEFLPGEGPASDLLFERLTQAGYPPKASTRRGAVVLYYKESEQIEDLLTMMGAVKCSLELMELKIYKDLRNRANRATNCETANIDKLVRAAHQQLLDIALLRRHDRLSALGEEVEGLARLREENPDASLSELAALSGLSRSAVNRRLARIAEQARRLREDAPEPTGRRG